MNSEKSRCVIIGSGRTGRGFLAPLVHAAGWDYSFVDEDETLVEQLTTHATHVRYFGGERSEWTAPPARAHLAGSASAETALSDADLIITAVGVHNLPAVATWLTAWSLGRQSVPPVVACENGIDVTRPFTDLGYAAPAVQAAVFCTTTLDPTADELGLVSEDVPSIPFDATQGSLRVPSTFEPRQDFAVLMQRKLYTYNALTAVISYPGALLNQDWLADAACLPSVRALVSLVRRELDVTLEREFGLSADDQRSFSQRALDKFQNFAIADPVERNTRDVVRKLASNERIVAPMLLAHKHGVEPVALSLVLASAIAWGLREGEISKVDALACWGVLPPSDRQRVAEQILPTLVNCPLTEGSLETILDGLF